MIVDRARNSFTISKADKATNKSGNPALHTSFDSNGAAQPANTLVDEYKEAKIASVRNSLFDDELDAVKEPVMRTRSQIHAEPRHKRV